MKKIYLLFTGSLLAISFLASGQSKKPVAKSTTPQEITIKNNIDSVSYALGVMIANNLKQQGFDSLNLELFKKSIEDAFNNKGQFTTKQSQEIVNQNYMAFQRKKAERNLKEGQKFLEENKKKPGVVALPSGLQYMVLKEGSGPKPTANDKVTTHYHGTLINGTVFDSSVERGSPATFPVNGVIQGWVEALQLMPVGSKWRLFIPAHLAYGERGSGNDIGPNSTLIFDVELLSIN